MKFGLEAGAAVPEGQHTAPIFLVIACVHCSRSALRPWVCGATAGDGSLTFSTGAITGGTTAVTFAVDNISAGGLVYDSAANTDPDGDSDGTTITVSSPP